MSALVLEVNERTNSETGEVFTSLLLGGEPEIAVSASGNKRIHVGKVSLSINVPVEAAQHYLYKEFGGDVVKVYLPKGEFNEFKGHDGVAVKLPWKWEWQPPVKEVAEAS